MSKAALGLVFSLFVVEVNATVGDLEVFNCTYEESQTAEVTSEFIALENNLLYASAFNGNIAEGTGGVEASSRTGNDRTFVKSVSGDTITLTLTAIGTSYNKTINNYEYVERLDAKDVPRIILKTGFCTSYKESQIESTPKDVTVPDSFQSCPTGMAVLECLSSLPLRGKQSVDVSRSPWTKMQLERALKELDQQTIK